MSFYWITRLDAILIFCGIAAVALFVVVLVLFISSATEYNEEEKRRYRKPAWIMLPFFVLFALSCVFVPSTKQACAIYAVDYLQNNKDARELPDKMIKSANAYFDKLLKEQEKEQEQQEK